MEEKPFKMFFFGGYITKDVLLCNDSFIYDSEDNIFTEVKNSNDDEIPYQRTDHSLVSHEENIYLFGGLGANKVIFGDFKKINTKTCQWKTIKGEGAFIKPRFGHAVGLYSGSMFLFGGWDGKNCLNDLYQYSFLTNIWYDLKATLGENPCPRYRHEGIVYKNSFYIFGGVDEKQTRFNDVYQFFFERKEWKKIIASGCAPTPRTFHRVTTYGNLMISVGGFDGERKNDIYFLALDTKENFDEEKFSLSRTVSFREENEHSSKKISDSTIIQILSKQVKELSEKLQVEEERHLCKVF
jgi:N-acetylneuraminic acid mutarotase